MSEYTTLVEVGHGEMPSFTPTTYDVPKLHEEADEHDERFSLWRYFSDGIATSFVAIITGGVANASPGVANPSVDSLKNADSGSGENGLGVFHGGQTYTVTSGEDTILTAAGYTVT